MSRKKKIAEVIEQEKSVESNDSIGYTGSVNLKLQRKGKIIKNSILKNKGTLRLMQALALSIQGVSQSILSGSFLPAYLDVGTRDTETKVTDTTLAESLLTSVGRVPVSIIYPSLNDTVNPDGYIAKFVGVIPYNIVSTQELKEFGLFADKSGDTLLARVVVSDDPIVLDQGMNLIIEWSLEFQNQALVVSNS